MMKTSDELMSMNKRTLEEAKDKIKENLKSLVGQDPYSDPDRVNDNAASDTEASEESAHERMEALEKELIDRLSQIEKSLSRIEQNKYGICEKCGKKIEPERLSAIPTASLCINCEEK